MRLCKRLERDIYNVGVNAFICVLGVCKRLERDIYNIDVMHLYACLVRMTPGFGRNIYKTSVPADLPDSDATMSVRVSLRCSEAYVLAQD